MWKFSYSFRIMANFYFINCIVTVETIQGENYSRGKLFKGGNYSRVYWKLIIMYIVPNKNRWDFFFIFELLKFKSLYLTGWGSIYFNCLSQFWEVTPSEILQHNTRSNHLLKITHWSSTLQFLRKKIPILQFQDFKL